MVRLLDEALVRLGDTEPGLRSRVLGELANRLSFTPPGERRHQAAREAVELARDLGDAELLARALLNWHDACSGPHNLEDRVSATDEVVSLCEGLGEFELAAGGRQRRLIALLEAGDLRAFDRELGVLAGSANEYRMEGFQSWILVAQAARSMMAGAFADAERLAGEGLAMGQQRGDLDAPSIFGGQIYQLRWDQGRLPELEGLAGQIRQATPDFPTWRAALVHLAVELGNLSQARAEFNVLASESFGDFERNRFWVVTMLLFAQVCADLGDSERAAVLYDLLKPFASRTGVLSFAYVCTGSNQRTLGLLCSAMRRWQDAADHFERALAANERLGAAPALARTQLDYAKMLLAKGDDDAGGRVQVLRDEALRSARELGMQRLEADANAIAL
jgi:hypothetical protein